MIRTLGWLAQAGTGSDARWRGRGFQSLVWRSSGEVNAGSPTRTWNNREYVPIPQERNTL
jgi:hypothetical protein